MIVMYCMTFRLTGCGTWLALPYPKLHQFEDKPKCDRTACNPDTGFLLKHGSCCEPTYTMYNVVSSTEVAYRTAWPYCCQIVRQLKTWKGPTKSLKANCMWLGDFLHVQDSSVDWWYIHEINFYFVSFITKPEINRGIYPLYVLQAWWPFILMWI